MLIIFYFCVLFVCAWCIATYLEKNQLGGDDSFEEDVDHQAQWERRDESILESEGGRPSDFFEKRSRNMERVEFALNNVWRSLSLYIVCTLNYLCVF